MTGVLGGWSSWEEEELFGLANEDGESERCRDLL